MDDHDLQGIEGLADEELTAMRVVLDSIMQIRRTFDALEGGTKARVVAWAENRVPAELPELYSDWVPE